MDPRGGQSAAARWVGEGREGAGSGVGGAEGDGGAVEKGAKRFEREGEEGMGD